MIFGYMDIIVFGLVFFLMKRFVFVFLWGILDCCKYNVKFVCFLKVDVICFLVNGFVLIVFVLCGVGILLFLNLVCNFFLIYKLFYLRFLIGKI